MSEINFTPTHLYAIRVQEQNKLREKIMEVLYATP